jgi:glycosyltransferase involved in cell wall biosynthesis
MTSATSPAVTVVIATRDRPALLREALDAVVAQDYAGDIECVIVHDQSIPDRSVECETKVSQAGHGLVRRLVRVVENTRTPGLAGARNTGVDAADGELIAFCDDDDVWLPEKLRLQVAELLRSGADVVVSGIRVSYESRIIERIPTCADVTLERLARRRVMEAHPSTVVVRREAFLDRIGAVDEEIPGGYGEDFDWILRAAEAGPIAVVERPLVTVRWGRQSYFSQRWSTIIAAIDYWIAKHAVFRAYPQALGRLYGQKAFALAALGERRDARRWALRCLRLKPREPRGYIALAISVRLLRAEWVLRAANSVGRGI